MPLSIGVSLSCADTYYSIGTKIDEDGKTTAVPDKALPEILSSTVGPGYVKVTSTTVEHQWFDPSPNVPRHIVTRQDAKSGDIITEEIPLGREQ